MPEYDERYINCAETIKQYSRKVSAPKSWGEWMSGRRASDFTHTYVQQRMNVHAIRAQEFGDAGDFWICSCGLKAQVDADFYQSEGHLFNGEVTQQIVIYSDEFWDWILYCQRCCRNEVIALASDKEFDGIPDVDVEKTLVRHRICVPKREV